MRKMRLRLKNKIFALFTFILVLYSSTVKGQKTLEIDEFLRLVGNYHPISLASEIVLQKGEATITKARGSFDPYAKLDMNEKNFESKEYYSLLNAGLVIPTWYGIELKTGYEANTGEFLNAENTVPNSGIWNAGISAPLGKGLFIDKRRATLKDAKLYSNATINERRIMKNDLFYKATTEYWEWVNLWNQQKSLEEMVTVAQIRFNAVTSSFLLGDKPAIDTLEAKIQLQNRVAQLLQVNQLYKNQTLELSTFLWYENNTPLEITDSLTPPLFSTISAPFNHSNDSLLPILNNLNSAHPELLVNQIDIQRLELEKRLKIESLKPNIRVQYNILNEPLGNDVLANVSPNNYKWGLSISTPIFLRKERGDLRLTNLKLNESELKLELKRVQVQNKVIQYYNEIEFLKDQVALMENVVSNYILLLDGEREKFNFGSSSLFLINSREKSLIESQLKLMTLKTKHQKAYYAYKWARGSNGLN